MKYPLTKTTTTFLAIVLPPDVQSHLLQLQQQLQSTLKNLLVTSHQSLGTNPVNWEFPDKLHISLAYLGRISASETKTVSRVITTILPSLPALNLTLGHLDYFYQKHDNGVLWIKAEEPNKLLINFHKQLVKQINSHGFSISEKKLVPHITLGRLKRMDKNSQMHILHALTDTVIPAPLSFTVDHLHLLTSHYRRDLNTTTYQIAQEFILKSN